MKPALRVDRYNSLADTVATLLAALALAVLALRAMLRLEIKWDTFYYHIPLAAKRAGIRVPFEMSDKIRGFYEGFPPLPEFVQGILWRATGSINATGVANYLVFLLFLWFCHRKLGGRFGIVTIVSLTAPLVLIHTTTSYIDLFGNAFLAIGVSSIVAMYLFDRFEDRGLLLWGLVGLAAAAWSKFQLLPVAAILLLGLLLVYGVKRAQPTYRRLFRLVVIATLIASAPYVKNTIFYHNPVWPVRAPVVGQYFPYSFETRGLSQRERPPHLSDLSGFRLFFHSLLEIHHPTRYPQRERWIIDQGNEWSTFRMGGFWNVAVITANAAIGLLAIIWNRRKGLVLLGSMGVMLCFVALQPLSNALRYYEFLPLTWAATIAMLLPRVRRSHPVIALAVLLVLLTEFLYVSNVNRSYYRVERIGYFQAAENWNAAAWWPHLQRGKVYCAVGFEARAIMLTGPTMSEFQIIDRPDPALCPPGVTVLRGENERTPLSNW